MRLPKVSGEGKESEARYRALIECFPGTFFELDSKGNFVLTNRGARELLGWCEEVLMGKRLARRVPREQLYKLLVIFKQAVNEGKGMGSIELKGEDAVPLPVNMSVVPIRKNREIMGFQCLIDSPETPRFQAPEDISTGIDLEGLIYPLCYELSSTLTIAKGALELALPGTEEEKQRFLELGRSALVRQQREIRNLMDTLKLDRMESELYLGEVDLKAVISSVANEFRDSS